jgi:uncharacterized membrane protein YGL010W
MPGINFNLMDQMVFYGSYHRKPGNQLIHFFFVPMIMWSAGVWLAYAGPVSSKIDLPSKLGFLPKEVAGAYDFNWAVVGFLLYTAYYVILEPFAGLSWGVILGIPVVGSCTYFQQHVPHAWAWALGAHLLAWFMQIEVGHIMIEHRRPALLDSFFQSLVLAGLFAWMEGLFTLGYRPKLQAELKRRIHDITNEDSKQTLLDAPPSS